MKNNLVKTTVKDIAYLINSTCLKAPGDTPNLLCSSDSSKVYLESEDGRLSGVIQAKHIAMKVLGLARQEEGLEEMLPAIAYLLNAQCGQDLAEPAVAVAFHTPLKTVLELMEQNHIRAIAVLDPDGHLVGTLDARNILSHYLHRKTEAGM